VHVAPVVLDAAVQFDRSCRDTEPPLATVRPGHLAACHFPGVASRATG
jgi:hypothetical protein